jgi:transcriptional regulator with XRE-family HTH domain
VNRNESLGEKLKTLRKERGWSQAKLAMKTNVARSHISLIELGRIKHPRADVLLNLAKGFGIRPEELYRAAGYISEVRAPYDYKETPEQVIDEIKKDLRRLEKMLPQKEQEKKKEG